MLEEDDEGVDSAIVETKELSKLNSSKDGKIKTRDYNINCVKTEELDKIAESHPREVADLKE